METLGRLLTRLGVATSQPAAVLILLPYMAAWALFSPASLEWHSVVTISTFVMTLLIQRAEHRDTQAIHAKLDELLHANRRAHDSLTHLDDLEPEEIERHREAARQND